MNTKTLFEWFKEISKNKNSLEIAEELIKNNKEYKKSKFYKNTHLSIQKAYEIYTKNIFVSVSNFINGDIIQDLIKGKTGSLSLLIDDLISQIDTDKLEVLADKTIDKIYNVIMDNATLKDDIIKEIKKLRK